MAVALIGIVTVTRHSKGLSGIGWRQLLNMTVGMDGGPVAVRVLQQVSQSAGEPDRMAAPLLALIDRQQMALGVGDKGLAVGF